MQQIRLLGQMLTDSNDLLPASVIRSSYWIECMENERKYSN